MNLLLIIERYRGERLAYEHVQKRMYGSVVAVYRFSRILHRCSQPKKSKTVIHWRILMPEMRFITSLKLVCIIHIGV